MTWRLSSANDAAADGSVVGLNNIRAPSGGSLVYRLQRLDEVRGACRCRACVRVEIAFVTPDGHADAS